MEDAPGTTVNRMVFEYSPSRIDLLKKQIAAFRISLENLDFPETNTFIETL